jgi:5-methylcytosine-specific restriction endonuclease McrA
MTIERKHFEIEQKRQRIFQRDNYICLVCGEPARQIAHGISNSKMNLKKYGDEIVNHDFNLFSVCSLACNSKMNIDNKPNDILAIIERINNENLS